MKQMIFYLLLISSFSSYAQTSELDINEKISTLDFVQVLDNNMDEALFYYKNNWQELRDSAVARGYISSYELMETKHTDDAPFHFILKTTYSNSEQFKIREENFEKLIEQRGDRKLLNLKQPKEFRKIIFSKESVLHRE